MANKKVRTGKKWLWPLFCFKVAAASAACLMLRPRAEVMPLAVVNVRPGMVKVGLLVPTLAVAVRP